MTSQFTSSTLQILSQNGQKFLGFLPQLLVAVVIFFLGWFISSWVSRLLAKVLRSLGLEEFLEKSAWQQTLQKSQIDVDISGFVELVVKWSLMIIFLAIATDIIGLHQFTAFLTAIIYWLPNLMAAILILVATAVFAQIISHLVRVSIHWSKAGYSKLAGTATKWLIWIFAILAISRQLSIMPEISLLLNKGLVYLIVVSLSIALGLGFGLAFGLGGQDIARKVLKKWIKDSEEESDQE